MSARIIVTPLLLLSAVLVFGCDGGGPTAPSPSPSPGPSAPPAPAPPAPAPQPQTETWNISMRMTAASGGECVGDTMRPQIGMAKSYTLAITPTNGKVDVTLKSASGDYACTFHGGRRDASGFTIGHTDGYFSCEAGGEVYDYLCDTGARRGMFALGQNLDGHISGNQISGTWNVSWAIYLPGQRGVDIAYLETLSEYSGSR